MDLKWFRVPKDIVFGQGTLEYLSTISGKKAVLVTGGHSMKKFGFLDQAKEELEKAGMDVMTHAIESYTSSAATCYTKPLSMESIKMVSESLTSACKNGDDLIARENMHNASTLAGMAFTSASLGIVHSMAHKIGGELGITHGLANAVLLPYVIEYNRKSTGGFDEIEKMLGVDDIVTTIKEMNQIVGIPLSLKDIDEVDVSKEKFKGILERMSINAFNDPCTLTNPRNTSPEDIKEIFLAAYNGTTAKNI